MQDFREKGNERGNTGWNMKGYCKAFSRLMLNIGSGIEK
jgi:hypothetical protein